MSDTFTLEAGSITDAVRWLQDLLLGPLGTSLALLSVAFIGLRMLQGFFSARDGFNAIFGCFILFGAPVLAGVLITAIENDRPTDEIMVPPIPAQLPSPSAAQTFPKSAPSSRANPFDPYSGAPGKVP